MIDINKPIGYEDLDNEFLRKLFLLSKTYGNFGEHNEIKDFVDFAFKEGKHSSPTDEEYDKPFT